MESLGECWDGSVPGKVREGGRRAYLGKGRRGGEGGGKARTRALHLLSHKLIPREFHHGTRLSLRLSKFHSITTLLFPSLFPVCLPLDTFLRTFPLPSSWMGET